MTKLVETFEHKNKERSSETNTLVETFKQIQATIIKNQQISPDIPKIQVKQFKK